MIRIEDYSGELKSLARDCRLGHCRHPGCRGRVERIFRRLARTEMLEPVEPVEGPEQGSGYTKEEEAAMWKDYMRDRRGRDGIRQRRNRRSRRVETNASSSNLPRRERVVVVILRQDGSLDKTAMRERQWFGSSSTLFT